MKEKDRRRLSGSRTRKNPNIVRKGFTMVELIVVLVILVILAAVAIPALLGYIDSSREKRYVTEAEAALASTQAALTDVYNDGNNRLTPSRREVAEAEAGFEAGKTSFTVWTTAQLVDGETKAVSENIGSYTVSYAKFVADDGTVVVYSGSDWTVYEDETAAKTKPDEQTSAALDSNGNVTGCTAANVIKVWRTTEEGGRITAGTDTAFDPTSQDYIAKDWNEDDTILEGLFSIKVNFIGYIDSEKVEGASTTLVRFGENDQAKNTYTAIFTQEKGFGTYATVLNTPYLQAGTDAGYDVSGLKWDYEGIRFDSISKLAEYLSPDAVFEALEGTEITVKAYMPHDFAPFDVTFGAYRDATQTVALSGMPFSSTATADKSKVVASGNTVTLKYDKVTGDFTEESQTALDGFENYLQVSQSESLSQKGENIATYSGQWLIVDDSVEATEDDPDAEEQYLKNADGTYKTLEADGIGSYVMTAMAADASSVVLKTPADINKTIYLRAVEDKATFAEDTLTKTDAKVFDRTFKRNELLSDEIRDEKNIVVDANYSIVDQSEMQIATTKNLAGVERKNKIRSWTVYTCNKAGDESSLAYLDETKDKDVTDELAIQSFFTDTENFGDTYGKLAEVEVGYLNAQLEYNEYDAVSDHRNDLALLGKDFRQLVGITNTRGEPENLTGLTVPVAEVCYINKSDREAYGYYSSNFYKEMCVSTTKLIEEPSDGHRFKGWTTGDYEIDETRMSEEYPDYIIAYSVKNGDTYNIYVFTEEDDSDLKADGSLQSLFAAYRGMTFNNFVEHLDTTDVTRFKGMFAMCTSLEDINLSTFDITSAADVTRMFWQCAKLESFGYSSGFDTKYANYFDRLYAECPSLTSVPELDIRSAYDIQYVFYGCEALTDVVLKGAGECRLGLPKELTGTDWFTQMGNNSLSNLLNGCKALKSIRIQDLDLTYITSLNNIFNNNDLRASVNKIELLNVKASNMTSTSALFRGFEQLTYVDLTGFEGGSKEDGIYVNASSMFNGCTSLTGSKDEGDSPVNYFELGGFDRCVSNAESMFSGCTSLTTVGEDGIHIDHASNIKNMFANCGSLSTIKLVGAGMGSDPGCPLTVGNTTGVFSGCSLLKDITISDINFVSLTGFGTIFTSAKGSLESVTFEKVAIPEVTTFANLFQNAGALKTVTFTETETKYVTSMRCMFEGCTNLTTGNLGGLDTSSAEDMAYMFKNCKSLTIADLGLDTTSAKNMYEMFRGCDAEGNTTTGDAGIHVDNATTLQGMFQDCSHLTEVKLVGAGKDVNRTADLDKNYATNIFNGCSSLTDVTLDKINFGNLAGLGNFFTNIKGTLVNATISNSAVPSVTSFGNLFQNAGKLESVSFEGTDTSDVTNMSGMFNGCTVLESEHLSGLDTSSAIYMQDMFKNCAALKISALNIDTTNATNMSNMFNGCNAVENTSTGEFHIDSATSIGSLFANCSYLTDATLVGTSNSEASASPLPNNGGADSAFSNDPIERLTIKNIYFSAFANENKDDNNTGLHKLIRNANNKKTLQEVEINNVSVPQIQSFYCLFSAGNNDNYNNLKKVTIKDLSSENLKSTRMMFSYCRGLTNLDLSGLDTSAVTNMSAMFHTCIALTSDQLQGLNTSATTNMQEMFRDCEALTISALSIDTTKATNMGYMFYGCKSTANTSTGEFHIDSATTMQYVFANCTYLTDATLVGASNSEEAACPLTNGGCDNAFSNTPIERLTIKNAYFSAFLNSNSDNMDSGIHKLIRSANNSNKALQQVVISDVSAPQIQSFYSLFSTGDNEDFHSLTTVVIRNLSAPNLKSTRKMFNHCRYLTSIDLSGLDTSNVTNMSSMFNSCFWLPEVDLRGFDTSKVTNMSFMFSSCYSLTTLNLTSFDTSACTDFKEMFQTQNKFNGSYTSNLTTIRVSNRFVVQKPNANVVMFGNGLTNLTGGAGSTMNVVSSEDPNNYQKQKYARIDSEDARGYFTGETDTTLNANLNQNWLNSVLAKGSVTSFGRDQSITEAEAMAKEGVKNIAPADAAYPVYVWQEGNGIKWWSAADKVIIGSGSKEMFKDWTNLATVDLSGLVFSEMTDMSSFFYNCKALTSVDFGDADLSKVTKFDSMFENCSNLSSVTMQIDTSKVSAVTMNAMFKMSGIQTVNITGDWSKVTEIKNMFDSAQRLETMNFGNHVDFSSLTTMEHFMHNTGEYDGNVSNWEPFNAFKASFQSWDFGDNQLLNTKSNLASIRITNYLGYGNKVLTDYNNLEYIVDSNKYLKRKR